MLIDNENINEKVFEWIDKNTETGKFDIVTGYFTIGALAYLSKTTDKKISEYRFILGDIVNTNELQNHTINLLNQNIGIEDVLRLNKLSREAVKFLKQKNIKAKTLEPNFCHAKAYLFDAKDDDRHNYFITGSSNLTEAGIGLKKTNNIELNIAETGDNPQFQTLSSWFDELWIKPEAHDKKTITDEKGGETKVDFKEYLISQIEAIFDKYEPVDIYYKILFELFGEELSKEQDDPKFSKEIGKLENTTIYGVLYDFQKKGVLSLVKMMEKYSGAILADAVGLGKTWSALAVMKYYQLQGRKILLLCPKKLENNWKQYLKTKNSRFADDNFDYIVRYHTDLFEDRLQKGNDVDIEYLQGSNPMLIVIDESHNLRNASSNRYKFLVENLLRKNQNLKVLLLSATPINNSLNDIKNQFSLLVKDRDSGFEDTLDIKSLRGTFKKAQKEFKTWTQKKDKTIGQFVAKLPPNFIRLTDQLTIARTRDMIKNKNLKFPKKQKPQNIYISPENIGDIKGFEALIDALPPKLTAYKPTLYIEQSKAIDSAHDEQKRDKALVKLMYILLIKRFESSWSSFDSTIQRILKYHTDIYTIATRYRDDQDDQTLKSQETSTHDDDIFDDMVVGKREIKVSQIDKCGLLDDFISDLDEDITAMNDLIKNLGKFKKAIKNKTEKETKLEKLVEIINQKKKQKNKKILIFTAYTDTAQYIYDELEKRNIDRLALVHGGTKDYETILQRFAPYTKLFNEKSWDDFKGNTYKLWQTWIKANDTKTQNILETPIDILIATDVLSEGQNLQDADMVINYDIHWNPVRVIQRMGRIDRIGSPNKTIQGINFWPSKSVDEYLKLQTRIENKMSLMTIAGSEVDTRTTDNLTQIAQDKELSKKQEANMMKKMQGSWDDIETNDSSLGFSDLSLERFRQDLFDKMKNSFYTDMPNGVFSGFVVDKDHKTDTTLIALLKNRQNNTYELIHIDKHGDKLLQNHNQVLEFLSKHKDNSRDVPKDIDDNNITKIEELQDMLYNWAKNLSGTKTIGLIDAMANGSQKATDRIKQNKTTEQEFDISNYDLIVWLVVG